jgi:pyrimidine-specific ribonucleoside hydrolase
VFDYNYELDTKSMDVILNSPIPLVFAGYEPSSYTHIGNIDLASLDRSEEADKWLFDVVQPWMEKTRSILALEDLFLLTVRRLPIQNILRTTRIFRSK